VGPQLSGDPSQATAQQATAQAHQRIDMLAPNANLPGTNIRRIRKDFVQRRHSHDRMVRLRRGLLTALLVASGMAVAITLSVASVV